MLVIMQAAPPARGIFWSTLVIILLLIHVTITEEISENQDDKGKSLHYCCSILMTAQGYQRHRVNSI